MLLGCINIPAFVRGGCCDDSGIGCLARSHQRYLIPHDRGICGVWSTVGCCRPWPSLLFLLVAIVGTVCGRPCLLLAFFGGVVIVFVVCGHPFISLIIIFIETCFAPVDLFPPPR